MDRKKIIYIGSLLIITAIISIASFSYAIWSRTDEQHGKINIVAGTLNYELISSDLNNNSITIPAGTNKTLEIEIKSLNTIDSKYELYYTTTNNGISIGYSVDTVDEPTGTITANASKKVTVIIKNRTNSSGTITFGCQGGFSSKQLVLAEGNSLSQMAACTYNSGDVVKTASYTGGADPFNPECDGYYKVELWGASGGNFSGYTGGKGSYNSGIILLNENQQLYLYVGGEGNTTPTPVFNNSTINCYAVNGNSCTYGANGGGATDLRITNGIWNNEASLNSRIMVSAGGSGAEKRGDGYGEGNGAAGGGLTGNPGQRINYSKYGTTSWTTPTQTTHASLVYNRTTYYSAFGNAFLANYPNVTTPHTTGGGGYYAGVGFAHGSGSSGSSYISGHTGCVAIAEGSTAEPRAVKISGCATGSTNIECSKHYSGLYFINTNMIDGAGHTWTNTDQGIDNNNLMPNPSGGYYASGIGHTGDGYARITYLGEGSYTTLYSAASDTVYYYDDNNNRVDIGTTDSTGKLENVLIPHEVTLYSTVAKDPTNLSNPYSKTFNVISNETYLMPGDNNTIMYWYGYGSNNLTIYKDSNAGTVTKATNNVTINHYVGVVNNAALVYTAAKKDLTNYNNIKMTIRFTDSATYVQHFGITNASPNLSGWTFNGGYVDLSTSTLSQVASFDISAKSGSYYFGYETNAYPQVTYIDALWLE